VRQRRALVVHHGDRLGSRMEDREHVPVAQLAAALRQVAGQAVAAQVQQQERLLLGALGPGERDGAQGEDVGVPAQPLHRLHLRLAVGARVRLAGQPDVLQRVRRAAGVVAHAVDGRGPAVAEVRLHLARVGAHLERAPHQPAVLALDDAAQEAAHAAARLSGRQHCCSCLPGLCARLSQCCCHLVSHKVRGRPRKGKTSSCEVRYRLWLASHASCA
jgi:hypothetical protein